MRWVTNKHILSTDGKTEKICCELFLNFKPSRWNKNTESPVLRLFYYDYKIIDGWWIDDKKFYTPSPQKRCEIQFNYFQRMPNIEFLSGEKRRIPYKDFSLEFCQREAVRILKENLNDLISQCETK